jgi:uncharacterized protein (DUF1015 family)
MPVVWPQVVARVKMGHLPYDLITVGGSRDTYELNKYKFNYIIKSGKIKDTDNNGYSESRA